MSDTEENTIEGNKVRKIRSINYKVLGECLT